MRRNSRRGYCPGVGPDDDGGRRNADNPMTKEEAAVEAVARYDPTVAKTAMRGKNLLVVEMFALAEVMPVHAATTSS